MKQSTTIGNPAVIAAAVSNLDSASKTAIGVALAGVVGIAGYAVYKVISAWNAAGETLVNAGTGIKDGIKDVTGATAREFIEKYEKSDAFNGWNSLFWKQVDKDVKELVPGTRLYGFSPDNGKIIARRIEDAFGVLNDNELQIYAQFDSVKSLYSLSQVSYYYQALYNAKLYDRLVDKLSSKEFKKILERVEKLPNYREVK